MKFLIIIIYCVSFIPLSCVSKQGNKIDSLNINTFNNSIKVNIFNNGVIFYSPSQSTFSIILHLDSGIVSIDSCIEYVKSEVLSNSQLVSALKQCRLINLSVDVLRANSDAQRYLINVAEKSQQWVGDKTYIQDPKNKNLILLFEKEYLTHFLKFYKEVTNTNQNFYVYAERVPFINKESASKVVNYTLNKKYYPAGFELVFEKN